MNLLLAPVLDNNWFGLPYYDADQYPGNTLFSPLGLWSVGIAAIAIAIAIGIAFIIDKRYKWFERAANRLLMPMFIAVWVFGFIVYDIGMYTGHPLSLFGNAPMAIVHAFGIFIFDSDISAIHEPFHNNKWFMVAFSLVHFLAALVSFAFVLKHFGYNIVATFKRWFTLSAKETTYVFWGMNDATYYLAKSINKESGGNKNYRIVVIRTNSDTDTDEADAKNCMERLFNFLSLKSKDLDRLRELDCVTISTYSNLATIDTKAVDGEAPFDILHKMLNMSSLCRIIRKKTTGTVHFFFLSDNEEANIQAVANLRNDLTVTEFAHKGNVKFYCHARYNSIHRVIEDELANERMEVKIVDSSHICVELMKAQPELHPVNYVQVEEDATVSTAFNALVVGFSEVGIDTVRFLYEYGAFVKSGSKAVVRSDFSCRVVDANVDEFAGLFTINAPALKTKMMAPGDTEETDINLYKMDCRSIEFYKLLRTWIENLNYIVIATGDDETNIALAVRIFRLCIQLREDKKEFERLRILVRVQHDENGHMQKIASHYNRLWAANDSSSDKNRLHQNTILATQLIDTPITLFGSAEQVYTYDYIIAENQKEDAKKFKRKYDLSIYELQRMAGKEPDKIVDWDEEQNQMMQLTGELSGFAPTYSAVMKLRRIQKQNISNSLHKETKILLAKKALREDFDEMAIHGLTRKVGSKTYTWQDHSNQPIDRYQRVLDTLAQTEHLRWNASHEILGYKDDGDEKFKDEAKLKHGCLKDWDDLTEETQSYDYNIVDVSLNLIEKYNK